MRISLQKGGRALHSPMCDRGRGARRGVVNPLCMYVADLEPAHEHMCSLTYLVGCIAG